MTSLKDLKNRIGSVKNTRKITKAMQMVAAAKLRRAQDAAVAARPYAERMIAVMAWLSASVINAVAAPQLLAGTGSEKVHLLVVMTAERGLAGGFNSYIAKLAKVKIGELRAEGKTVKIMTIGRKGRDQLRRDHREKFVHHVDLTGIKRLSYPDAQAIAQEVLSRFAAEDFDIATLFFNRFKSVMSQVPTAQQLIPARFTALEEGEQASGQILYEYEPEEEAILADLLPRAIATQIFTALLENAASEQGARMAAMDNATRNAGELIDKLTLVYNRSRQATITKELIEIISGAEAL